MGSEQMREEFMSHYPCWPFIMDLLSHKVSTGVLKNNKKAMQPTVTDLRSRAPKFPSHLSNTNIPTKCLLNFDMNTYECNYQDLHLSSQGAYSYAYKVL